MSAARTLPAAGLLGAVLALPLFGAWLADNVPASLWRFPPPLNVPADYPRFSWLAVGLVSAVSLAVAWPWARRWGALAATRSERLEVPAFAQGYGGHCKPLHPSLVIRPFPWWGWAAAGWMLLWWLLAWTRFEWFAWAQRYTFTPLWLGFIVIVNALAWKRSGTCLIQRAPGRWAALFAASAAFWWVFEWLNRFVRNWHYLGAEGVDAREYAIHASVCFSTVLPAVAGVREWLGTFPRLQARLGAGPRWAWLDRAGAGFVLIALGAAGLVLTGARPLYFYPALWSAPLLVGAGWMVLRREDGWWREIACGDWREAGSWALGALACGFFWELWNVHSMAKWIYTVPFVQRWQVFEMPLPGYTGYLPFGLECALVAGRVIGRKKPSAAEPQPKKKPFPHAKSATAAT